MAVATHAARAGSRLPELPAETVSLLSRIPLVLAACTLAAVALGFLSADARRHSEAAVHLRLDPPPGIPADRYARDQVRWVMSAAVLAAAASSEKVAFEALRRNVRADLIPGTGQIRISCSFGDPDLALRLGAILFT
ncbi:MAG: hypothetical protein FJW39_27025 [Acidobacteria bacterium]|nr:hypothetical protein [Acidobacteriota bacterium]